MNGDSEPRGDVYARIIADPGVAADLKAFTDAAERSMSGLLAAVHDASVVGAGDDGDHESAGGAGSRGGDGAVSDRPGPP